MLYSTRQKHPLLLMFCGPYVCQYTVLQHIAVTVISWLPTAHMRRSVTSNNVLLLLVTHFVIANVFT